MCTEWPGRRALAPVLMALWVVGVLPVVARGQGSAFALRFYGTGVGPPGQQDRVRIPIDDNGGGPDASSACDVGAGSFTIDFWLRGTLAANGSANGGGDRETFDFNWILGNVIVDRDIFGGSDRDWGISIAGGFVRFGVGDGDAAGASENTIEGNVNVLDNTWHHVACVRDFGAGRLLIYVDGQLDIGGSTNVNRADLSYPNAGVPGQATPWGPFIVLAAEKHDAGAEYPSFNGYMDELRVWNVALTGSEIFERRGRVIAADTAGLVGYFRFEAGSGTVIVDSSAVNSPAGLLIAGVPGNGEWVSAAGNVQNTAPVSSEPAAEMTIAAEVVAGDRNAEWYPSSGQQFANGFDGLGLCCGRDGGGEYQIGLEFALPIPRGSTILSAVLEVTATTDQNGAPTATMRAYDVADAPRFVAGSPTRLDLYAPQTAAAATWVMPVFAPAGVYTSPQLSALVQEVIDRGDWAAGNFLGITLIDAGGAGGDRWRCIRNFASGEPATLRVSYVAPDPCAGAAACDANCDGVVSVGDIGAFVQALVGGEAAWAATFGGAPPCGYVCVNDVNGDGVVTVGDIGGFVACLVGR